MTSKIKQIPFKKEHIELIDIRDRENNILKNNPALEQRLLAIQNYHSAMTLTLDGVILGVIGFIPISPGVIEVWLVPSKHIFKYSIAFARLMRYYRENIVIACQWHRMQLVAPNDDLHNKWASFLGFEKEGILKQWGHDKTDHVMWAIVR